MPKLSPSRSMPSLKLGLALALLICFMAMSAVYGQGTQSAIKSFEGTVTYAITYDGADREAVELNEPPKTLVMYIRMPDFILHTRGGRFAKSLLYINDSNRVYSIDAKNNRAFSGEKFRVRRKPPVATATGDSMRVLGRVCYAYRFTTPATKREPARTTTLWVSPTYRVDVSLIRPNSRAQAYFLVQGIDCCIPLRIEVAEPNLTTVTTATAITPKVLPAVEFTLPKGMTVLRQLDYRR